jgi:hypothetical protein
MVDNTDPWGWVKMGKHVRLRLVYQHHCSIFGVRFGVVTLDFKQDPLPSRAIQMTFSFFLYCFGFLLRAT